MIFRTHLALGFLIALFVVILFKPNMPIIFLTLTTLFSALPDIDHPKSNYGRMFPVISWPISLIFKHRGFFHSIFPPTIGFLILNYYNFTFIAWAILIGYLAHLIGDAITIEGINFLHPFSTFHIKGPLRTGAILETLLFYI